jgi:hypothetical protein
VVERRRAQGARWLKILEQFSVRFLALDLEADRGLVEFFLSQPGWVVDCRDRESVLFVRASDAQESDGVAVIQRNPIPAEPGRFARLPRS